MDTDLSCKQCPVGTTCVNRSTLATLNLEPGYFRFDDHSTKIYECTGKKREENQNCDGGRHVEAQCAPASKGPLCARCEPGNTMVYTGRCEACGDSQTSKFLKNGGWLIIGFFILIAGFMCAVRAEYKAGRDRWSCIRALRDQKKTHVVHRLKIVWTCYQIIAQTIWTLPEVVFPPIVESMIRWVSTLTVFSLDINLPLNCIYPNYNYYQNVIVTNVGGPAVVGILAALAVARRQIRPVAAEAGQPLELFGVKITNIALLLSYMVLPAVSTATLKLFTCTDFRPGGGPVVLADDMSVECWTEEPAPPPATEPDQND